MRRIVLTYGAMLLSLLTVGTQGATRLHATQEWPHSASHRIGEAPAATDNDIAAKTSGRTVAAGEEAGAAM